MSPIKPTRRGRSPSRGDPVSMGRRIQILEIIWESYLLGLSLIMGPMINHTWALGDSTSVNILLGVWAAALYSGKLLASAVWVTVVRCMHLQQSAPRCMAATRALPGQILKLPTLASGASLVAVLCMGYFASSFWATTLFRVLAGAFAGLSRQLSCKYILRNDSVPAAWGVAVYSLGMVLSTSVAAFVWNAGFVNNDARPFAACLVSAAILMVSSFVIMCRAPWLSPLLREEALVVDEGGRGAGKQQSGVGATPSSMRSVNGSIEEGAETNHMTIELTGMGSSRAQPPGAAASVPDFEIPRVPTPPTPAEIQARADSLTDDQVPERLVLGSKGDVQEAKTRWAKTLIWREAYNVDGILNEPQPNFHTIKRCYPHFIHGISRDGYIIYIEQVGRINFPVLAQHGIGLAGVSRHYTFHSEFMWNRAAPAPDTKCVTLVDLHGITMRDAAGDGMEFVRTVTKICQDHYVNRSFKIFVVNAPFWFSMPWKVISPLLHPRTRKKINILGVGVFDALYETLERTELPPVYGGTGEIDLGESQQECDMRVLVDQNNAALATSQPHSVGLQSRLSRAPTSDGSALSFSSSDDSTSTGSPRNPASQVLSSSFGALGRWGGSLVSAVASPFSGGGGATQAHLGKSNRFVYDKVKEIWVLEGDSDDESTVDEMEERLIRAIQAAHISMRQSQEDDVADLEAGLPEKLDGMASGSGGGIGTDDVLGLADDDASDDACDMLLPGDADVDPSMYPGSALASSRSARKGAVSIITAVLHFVWRVVHMSAFQISIILLLEPDAGGGLGMAKGISAIVLCCASALWASSAIVASTTCASTTSKLLSQPLARTLRIAITFQIVALVILASLPLAKRQTHSQTIVIVCLLVVIGAIECALIFSQAHRGVWITSLPEYRGRNSVRYWALVFADGAGTLLGPMIFGTRVPGPSTKIHMGGGLRPTHWLHIAAAIGLAVCTVSLWLRGPCRRRR